MNEKSIPERVWFSSVGQAKTVEAWGAKPPRGCYEYVKKDLYDSPSYLLDALEELWQWVKNWDAEFMDDDEFDRSIFEDAIKKAKGEQ